MAKIHTVVKGYTGVRASVPFVEGVGETDDPHLISWFREHGYTVEDPEVPEAEKSEPEEKPTQRRNRRK